LFRAHLDAVVSTGVRAVTVSQLVHELASSRTRERLLAITFDDGFASVAEHAAPLLAERGLPATVFCVAGHVGGRNDWEGNRSGAFESPLVTAEQISALASAGLEIGSHGFAHAPVSETAGASLERELVHSKEVLEGLTGGQVRSYAYPYGALPGEQARKLVEATYDAACTTHVASVPSLPDVHELPRVDAHYLRRPELLRRALSGRLEPYLALRRAGARARRAVLSDYTRP
jgi:peptidoglycan/xylan/chitin deacetylase (PgdA/CDA1 family)